MIPFEPQPLKKIKQRAKNAFQKIFYVSESDVDRPGFHRANVFDFENGNRIIASIDKIDKDHIQKVYHFSASTTNVQLPEYLFIPSIQHQVWLVWQFELHEPTDISEKGIPHWIVPIPTNEA